MNICKYCLFYHLLTYIVWQRLWLLISYRRQGASDAHILEGHPDLSAADLVNAFAYAEAHVDEIDRAIIEQEEA